MTRREAVTITLASGALAAAGGGASAIRANELQLPPPDRTGGKPLMEALALRRSTRLPILTGENLELVEQALPFIQSQAVDCLQPDIVNAGGITGVKAMADLAAAYRMPITLHNVSGLLLNMASQQLAASIFDCPRIECTRRATSLRWATDNPLRISKGRMEICNAPGLGVTLDEDWLKAHRFAGEPYWG